MKFQVSCTKEKKYLVHADSNEIKIYNRWTGTLIGSYVSSFNLPFEQINRKNGKYEFYVRKNVFEEELSKLKLQ